MGQWQKIKGTGDERAFPADSVVENPPASAGDLQEMRFDTQVRKIPWRRKWQPTPVFLPGKFHGQKSLVDYGPWGLQRVGHDRVTDLYGNSMEGLQKIKNKTTTWSSNPTSKENKNTNLERYMHPSVH